MPKIVFYYINIKRNSNYLIFLTFYVIVVALLAALGHQLLSSEIDSWAYAEWREEKASFNVVNCMRHLKKIEYQSSSLCKLRRGGKRAKVTSPRIQRSNSNFQNKWCIASERRPSCWAPTHPRKWMVSSFFTESCFELLFVAAAGATSPKTGLWRSLGTLWSF